MMMMTMMTMMVMMMMMMMMMMSMIHSSNYNVLASFSAPFTVFFAKDIPFAFTSRMTNTLGLLSTALCCLAAACCLRHPIEILCQRHHYHHLHLLILPLETRSIQLRP